MFLKKTNLYIFIFYLLFGLILFPSNLKSVVILFFGILVLTRAIVNKVKFDLVYFINYSIIYLLILCTLFYVNDFQQAFYNLQTMSSLIVFPFLFSLICRNDFLEIYKKLNIYFWIQIVSVLVFHLAVFLWFSINYFTFLETIEHYQEIINLHLGKFSIHPIYLSINCCISLIFSYFLYQEEKRNNIKVIIIICQILLVILLILHSKKGPIISFL